MAHSERLIDASASVVYDALVDAERYPEWLVGAQRVVVSDGRWPREGSSFDHRVGAGPVQVADSTTVSENRPNREFDLVVRARPFLEADVRFHLESVECGTLLSMDETPRGVFRVLAPLIAFPVKLRNDRSLRNLAELIAGSSSPT